MSLGEKPMADNLEQAHHMIAPHKKQINFLPSCKTGVTPTTFVVLKRFLDTNPTRQHHHYQRRFLCRRTLWWL